MSRIIEIKESHLNKWSAIKEFVQLRPDVICYALLDESEVSGLVLADTNRVHFIHVNPEVRRGGVARTLLEYVTRNLSTGKMRAVVEPDNLVAVQSFLSCGFRIIGFDVTWKDNRYLMEYDNVWRMTSPDPDTYMKQDFIDMAEKMYVIESVPVRII